MDVDSVTLSRDFGLHKMQQKNVYISPNQRQVMDRLLSKNPNFLDGLYQTANHNIT